MADEHRESSLLEQLYGIYLSGAGQLLFFFFSSRRRHTRFSRDWSSDVCSSDLDKRALYHVALLRYAGCTAESHLDAALFGDEIAVRAAMAPVLFGSRAELFLAIARTMHAGEPARWRAVAIERALAQLRNTFRKGAAGHCEVTQAHALHLGLGTEIQAALGDVFERWDGNGLPAGRR